MSTEKTHRNQVQSSGEQAGAPAVIWLQRFRLFGPVVLMFAVVFSLAGWGIANYHRPRFDPPTATGAISPPANLRPDLARVLADQRQADRAHREAWIADGYSNDLQVLAGDGINPLATDAQDYLDTAYAGADGDAATAPPPGWQEPYAQVRTDLNALAAQYRLAPAPAPGYPVSGRAVPLHPWSVTLGGAGACTAAGGTVSSSVSSTGAHSQSVSVKTKCPSGTTTVTHKTSVTAKGAITNTTTTTTAPPSSSTGTGGSTP